MSLDSPKPRDIDATRFRVAVVAARYNEALVETLVEQVMGVLRSAGVKARNLSLDRVPGSNELPIAARLAAERRRPDVVIALGVIVRGGTIHYELIATAATDSLQDVALAARIPVINGIVVAENRAQARARCRGPVGRGSEFARAAIEMAALKRRLAR